MKKIFKRESYLKKIRGFYDDAMIKVITGIRGCGKSTLLKSIIEELKEKGVMDKDIIYIELDLKEYKDIKTPVELEKLIDSLDDVKGPFVVEIKDDNASLKAYKALTDRLDNLYIRYIEK